jgi:antitoxin FitA
LVAQAKARGQSLQAYLLDLVQVHAARAGNIAVLDRFAARSDGARSAPGETAAELAALRDGRDNALGATG